MMHDRLALELLRRSLRGLATGVGSIGVFTAWAAFHAPALTLYAAAFLGAACGIYAASAAIARLLS